MKEQLYLYFTSDLHSYFGHWPKIVRYLKEQVKRHKRRGEAYFILDNGDHLDRVHPITEAFLGSANVDLLNEAQFDAVTVGNNEGITLPAEDLFNLYNQAQFDVVCANLHKQDQKVPNWLKPYTILTTESGIKLGILGLTAPFNLYYEELGWYVRSPYEALNQYLPELSAKCDMILLLSHLGLNEDEYISMNYQEIDLIVGGHTHHLFKNGKKIQNTLLGAVGKFGRYVGRKDLVWSHQERRLTKKEGFAIDVHDMDDDPDTANMIASYSCKAAEILKKPIASMQKTYDIQWFQETELMVHLVDTLKAWTHADFAMLNAGIILEGIPKGEITRGDLHRICPHPINPCKVRITGEEIMEMIRMVRTKRFKEFQLKGLGFRGEVIGEMIFSGIEVVADQQSYIKEVLINGLPLEKKREYDVATADMFTLGKLLPPLASASYKEYYLPEFMRDLLGETVKKLNN
ncbi:2',3'-cyclic-nucleotide 2'-phosphodiesterase/5'-or 3'-nucleotidase, 5'-nucleotidase family [Salinibacillus kushneri]|uniref:2',3'-cyclic-nucleotide 2'-phosphodiesterase/5'-or 3'-nucleotidase, 5'-nucleotidase family n=1 Tax=Salinibacillus kushneri TaxID=237682 RepID=A0A1H9YA67_9BACI|nr:bifunctional UDP-sugar hydrolase/5'-nucleotidase [Salinibacillus kushneri]SES65693.1 2',3'-cyclic-nucleotide 2'-phosphodiesterase/5'-or 3'-nucleotidase, 5'-nucleotidase family [Salinibacillus kushneri]